MHPMMGLAALRGLIVVRHQNDGCHRLARRHSCDARAIFEELAANSERVKAGIPCGLLRNRLTVPEVYQLAELTDFASWDQVTEADIDWICELDT